MVTQLELCTCLRTCSIWTTVSVSPEHTTLNGNIATSSCVSIVIAKFDSIRRHSSSIWACQCSKRVSSTISPLCTRRCIAMLRRRDSSTWDWFQNHSVCCSSVECRSPRLFFDHAKEKEVVFHHRDGVGPSFRFLGSLIDCKQSTMLQLSHWPHPRLMRQINWRWFVDTSLIHLHDKKMMCMFIPQRNALCVYYKFQKQTHALQIVISQNMTFNCSFMQENS